MAAGSDQFIGEIRVFPFQAIPSGWLACEGQVLPMAQYMPLYGVISNVFGGNGTTTFALPDFRGKVPTGSGAPAPPRTRREVGESGGVPNVTLNKEQMPAHQHTLAAMGVGGNASAPGGHTFARSVGANIYVAGETNVSMSANAVGFQGSSSPHDNMQPYMALNLCIAYEGAYPQ
jgi:microcystin-dependent protein